MLKKFFKKIKIIFIVFCLASFAFANEDFDAIYDSLYEADFNYIFGIDPKQADDYTNYMHSPYPLFRTGVRLIFKTKVIPPGYYLLTPRERNGTTYVLFKENGKVSYTIPVYREGIVPEMFYKEKFPHPNPTFFQKISKKTMEFIGTKWGKKNQRTPIPEAYIDFEDEGGYWNMILYYGDKKYYLLFKKDE